MTFGPTNPDEISERWREHFHSLLNCDNAGEHEVVDGLEVLPLRQEIDVPPTEEEVAAALASLGERKAPGGDAIPAEILKFGGDAVKRALAAFYMQCWETKTLPQDFRDAKIVSIYKRKGDRQNCGNHRGISLLSSAGKVLARIMLTRLQHSLEQLLPESQCGFRKSRSTIDMIFTLRQLQEKAIEQHKPLFVVFVDFRKAFDMVDRQILWKVLQRYGCPQIFLEIIKQFHEGMRATVVAGGKESEPFDVTNGVRQGCVLAPALFSLFLTAVLRTAALEAAEGVSLVSRSTGKLFNLARLRARTKTLHVCIRELLYADDAALVAMSMEDLQQMVHQFSNAAALYGLQINTNKTEVLYQPSPGEAYVAPTIEVNNNVLKDVSSFTYLGSTLTNNNSSDAEVVRRIQAASAAFGKLKSNVFKKYRLRINTKIKLYKAIVIPTLTYALESCTLYRRHFKRLTDVQLRHARELLNIKWHDYVPNVEVLNRADMPSVEALLVSANLRWAGHVVRMDDSRLPKAVMYAELREGTRTVGGQKLRYKDVLKRNLKAAGGHVHDWEELARDRNKYREMCREAISKVEQQRRDNYTAAHDRRHNPPTAEVAVQCPHCPKICRGGTGLATHMRWKHN